MVLREGYDTAQVCLNGHVASSMAGSSPQFRQCHCEKRGDPTITECQARRSEVRARDSVMNCRRCTCDTAENPLCAVLTHLRAVDPRLAAVVEAWADLPDDARRAVAAMVQAYAV